MSKILVTETEFDALLAQVKPGAPPLAFSFGPGGTYLDTENDKAAWAVTAVEVMRADEADRLESFVVGAIGTALEAELEGRAAGDNAPGDEFPQAAATAVFRALKAGGYSITRK